MQRDQNPSNTPNSSSSSSKVERWREVTVRKDRIWSECDPLIHISDQYQVSSKDQPKNLKLDFGWERKPAQLIDHKQEAVRKLRNASIHSVIQASSIAPHQVPYYSDALPTQQGYCVGVSHRSTAGNCELRTCPKLATLWTKGAESTNKPPCTPHNWSGNSMDN